MKNIIIDTYFIMPNHIHLILFIYNSVGEIHEFPLHLDNINKRKIRKYVNT